MKLRRGHRFPSGNPVLQDPIVSQRNPFEVFLLLIAFVLSVLSLLGVSVSSSVTNQGEAVNIAWSIVTLFGSLLGLVGVLLPRAELPAGLQIERSGMILMAGGCFVFAGIVSMTAGWEGAWTVGTNAAFGCACVTRIIQITRRNHWYKVSRMIEHIQGRG